MGFKCGLVGMPNVGKSSTINSISNEKKYISTVGFKSYAHYPLN